MKLANCLLVTFLTVTLAYSQDLAGKPCKGRFTYETRQEGNEVVITVKSREGGRADLVLFSADNKGIERVSDSGIVPRGQVEFRIRAGTTYFIQVTWVGCSTTLGGVEGITSTQPSRR